MPTLLVIDDELSVLYSFQRAFTNEATLVLSAQTAAEGLRKVRESSPDVVILDLQLPDRSGLEVFHEIHAAVPRLPVIFITAHGTTDTAIEAMKGGAFDYLVKPVDLDRLQQILERAFQAARWMQTATVLPTEEPVERILGRSVVIQEMSKSIGRIAPQEVNVLILGESGSGKELVARALYQHSQRVDHPYLAINCAAIPENLLESELFGHEQGAFTGAQKRRIGKFEQCDGGTLFLDEIGDMSLPLQAKMLRLLQDQEFQRVGGNETLRTSVRILTATNLDLEKQVEASLFRKDLYYRLKVVTIRVPPLRERLEDVSELSHSFLFRFNRELNLDVRALAPQTLDLLQTYHWPGNVRELQGVIKQAMLNSSGHLLLPEFLPRELHRPSAALPAPRPADGRLDVESLIESCLADGQEDIHRRVLEAVERVLLPRVLAHTRGHQAQASDVLGLNRTTLRSKLRNLGLSVEKVVSEEPEPSPAEGS